MYRNHVILARQWDRALGDGDYSSRADLARKLGVCRARVAQVLRSLRLAPDVRDALVAAGDPLPGLIVTERKLSCIVSRPGEDQRREINVILSGVIESLESICRVFKTEIMSLPWP